MHRAFIESTVSLFYLFIIYIRRYVPYRTVATIFKYFKMLRVILSRTVYNIYNRNDDYRDINYNVQFK